MLQIFRQDTFIKDILVLLLVSIVVFGLFAAGFALTTNKYFAQAVTGIMGDFGQYDLLFQTRVELKEAMARQIRQIIAERFPGATLKPGISVVGKATFFLTLPARYKTKAVFNNIGNYFNNLPGNGDCSIMTEPRLNVSSVPAGVFDLLAREIERLPGVSFTYNDGGIGVILKDPRMVEPVQREVKKLLKKYQILEVRLNADSKYSQADLMNLSKKVSQNLLGVKGVRYAQDITMSSGTDDSKYLMNTLLQVKRFLMAYAAEVTIEPGSGPQPNVDDLLVANGQNGKDIKTGTLLQPLEVVIKVTAKNAAGIKGLIIQGDASYLRDNNVYQLLPGDKIGRWVGNIAVSNRKGQLIYAMDQAVKLLTKVNEALRDFNNTSGGAGITVSGIEQAYQRMAEVRGALRSVQTGISGLSGKTNRESLTRAVSLIDGVAGDLDFLAKTFGRVQILENRFNQALDGLHTAQFLFGNGLSPQTGIGDKMQLLNTQLGVVEDSLRSRVQKLDDFINRFNPLVATLLSWRNKAQDFANQINDFGAVFTPGSANQQQLVGLLHSTDQILANLTGFDVSEVKSGLNIISDHLFGSDHIDLSALIAELEKARDALPQLLDEEIGHSISLINKYAGSEDMGGAKIQIFTMAKLERGTALAVVGNVLNSEAMNVFSLPVGTIQPDIRGELFKILSEVRATIAALIVVILWVLTFILDQSLIISMLKLMEFRILPKKSGAGHSRLDKLYQKVSKFLNWGTVYAAVIGGSLLAASYALAGAGIPYVNAWEIGLAGAILGVLVGSLAEKINPIHRDEVMAGLSLGLPFRTIMREIVIPAGRPGLLQFLNRWKMVVK